jgi:hypothetical protein
MPSIPDPPSGSQELAEYSVGDSVYYYRLGTLLISFYPIPSMSDLQSIGKWRRGKVDSKGGSSTDSPRYLVSPIPSPCGVRSS